MNYVIVSISLNEFCVHFVCYAYRIEYSEFIRTPFKLFDCLNISYASVISDGIRFNSFRSICWCMTHFSVRIEFANEMRSAWWWNSFGAGKRFISTEIGFEFPWKCEWNEEELIRDDDEIRPKSVSYLCELVVVVLHRKSIASHVNKLDGQVNWWRM